MNRRTASFLLLLLFISSSPLSADGETGVISLSSGLKPGVAGNAFLADTAQIRATLLIPSNKEKIKINFKWIDPSGQTYYNSVKILFPSKNRTEASISDYIKVAGNPASGKLGWWFAEADFNGEILSKKFFLTNNRQATAFFNGVKEEKISILEKLNTSLHGAREMIDAAFQDSDEEIRASAIGAANGIHDEWAVSLVEKCMDDPAVAVRSKAFAALLLRGEKIALKAAEKASVDASPEIRVLAAEKVIGSLGQDGRKVMGALLIDKNDRVRMAALNSLAAAEGDWVTSTLAEGLKAEDPAFRKILLNVIAMKKGEKAGAFLEGLKDSEPAIRFASLNYLINKKLFVSGAVRPLVNDPVYEIAETALKELGRHDDSDGLRAALRSRHSGIRLQAVRFFSSDPARNAAALAEAMTDSRVETRKAAVAALSKSGRAGVPGLLAALKDVDEEIRADAASAIAVSKSKESEGGMLAAMSDESPRVRLNVIQYFISLGGPGLTNVLWKAACDDSQAVRSEALGKLVEIPGEDASEALAAFLACGDLNIKNTVIDSLAARKDAKARAALVSSIKDADAGIRFKAASGLLAAGVAAPLGGLLEDPEPPLRKIALAAVQASPDASLLPALQRLSKDPDPEIRFAVIQVLKGIKGDASAFITASMADDADSKVRLRAREQLISMPAVSTLNVLLSVAVSGEGEERKKAAEAISKVPGPQAEDALLRLLAEGDPELRIFALKKIFENKSPLRKEALRAALKDKDEKVRLTAVDRIGGMQPDEAYEVYTEAASSPYPEVVRAAVLGLKGNRDEMSIAIFSRELKNNLTDIKMEALRSLQLAGDTGYAKELPGLILDPDPDIRRAAFGAAVSLPDRKLKADALVAAAGGIYPDLSLVAATALIPLGDHRALPHFEKFFQEGVSTEEMLEGMTNVPGLEAVPFLERAFSLSSSNEQRKLKVVRSLDGRGPAAIGLLNAALNDIAPGVRQEAAGIIAKRWKEGGLEWEAALGQAVRHKDVVIRKTALSAVLKADLPVLMKYGVPALSDKELLETALAGLKERPEPEVFSSVFEHAKGLTDADSRAGAFRLLNEKGFNALELADAFSEEPSAQVKSEIINRLGGTSGSEAVFRLARIGGREQGVLRADAWKGIRGRSTDEIIGGLVLLLADGQAAPGGAAFLSENMDDPALLKQLILKTAKNTEAFKSALKAIINRHAACDANALVEAIGIADKEAGALAAHSLALVPEEEGDVALREAFRRYPASRVGLLEAVYRTPKIIRLMPLALKDKNAAVRLEAARSLKEISGAHIEDIIILGLSCPEEQIRLDAAEAALAGDLRKPLLKAASDSSPAVRVKAATGLGNFQDVPILKTFALEDEAGVSDAAIHSLKSLEDKVPSAVWGEIALKTGRNEKKIDALDILIARRDNSQAHLFARLLDDPDPDVSAKAEEGLTSLGAGALPEVHPLLKKKRLFQAAIRIITKTADRSSEPFILDVLPGLEDGMFMQALRALEKTGGDASLDYLLGLHRKGSTAVKIAAVKTLGGLRLSGETEAAAGMLSDELSSEEDVRRFYAAHSIGNLRFKSLKGALEKAEKAENSAIIKAEMEMALEKIRAPASGMVPKGF